MQGALSFVVVVILFAGLLRSTDLGEVGRAIGDMTWIELVTLLLFALWNLATYQFVLAAALPGLSVGQAGVASQTSTAMANTLPGGAAFGLGIAYAMYASWGFPPSLIALSLLVSGVWNTFVKLGMPVIALALLAVQGGANPGLVTASAVGVVALVVAVVLLALVLRSEALARRVGASLGRTTSRVLRLVRRPAVRSWGEAAVRFRTDTVDLLHRRWPWLTLSTLVSHVSLYLLLLLTLRHIGVSEDEVNWVEVLATFAFVRLLTALPITPGGLGVVELGLTTALVVAGGERDLVVAAVLVYRALTYVLPIPIGALTYVVWRRRTGWRREPEAPAAVPSASSG